MTLELVYPAMATAFVLAACSRNPEPGVDETGRADTLVVPQTDTLVVPQIDSARADTVPVVPPVGADTIAMPSDTGVVGRDSIMLPRDTVQTDTSVVQPQVPIPSDTTNADSAAVPHQPDKFEGDSALIERDTPDTTGRQ
jgi:hypothetical protein